MKDWFPLTDYDFYACVTSGVLLLAVADYVFFGAALIHQADWSVAQGAIWIGIAYVIGQLVAAPSSAVIEHLISRRWLHSPASIALAYAKPRKREKTVRVVFAQHEYAPLPVKLQDKIKQAAAERLGCNTSELDAETVFQIAFPIARTVEDTRTRLDRFIALYGFARNVCLAAMVAAGALTYALITVYSCTTAWLLFGAIVLIVGMFGRYMKFYAAYGTEVLRTFGKLATDPSPVPPPATPSSTDKSK